MRKIQTALRIAQNVRRWAEKYAHENNMARNLTGMCAIASAELWRRLDRAGIAAEIRVWESDDAECHVYIVIDDHVLDVTATQFRAFRKMPIVYMHEKEAEVYEYYCDTHRFNSAEELVEWQEDVGFLTEQVAWA